MKGPETGAPGSMISPASRDPALLSSVKIKGTKKMPERLS